MQNMEGKSGGEEGLVAVTHCQSTETLVSNDCIKIGEVQIAIHSILLFILALAISGLQLAADAIQPYSSLDMELLFSPTSPGDYKVDFKLVCPQAISKEPVSTCSWLCTVVFYIVLFRSLLLLEVKG